MAVIFSRSSFCHELFSELGAPTEVPVPMYLSVLTTTASGINLNRVYQDQTRPPLTLVLRNGRDTGLNATDYSWFLDIRQVATSSMLFSGRSVSFSTDELGDPVFQYEWQFGDNAVTGNYEAQIYGQLNLDGRKIVFEPYKYIVRPRI